MYIVSPLAGGQFATLFSTHPHVQERIRRLRAYNTEATSPADSTVSPAAGSHRRVPFGAARS
jgi:hypothetical protein